MRVRWFLVCTGENVGGQFCFLEIVFKNLFLAGMKFISDENF